MAEVRTLLSYQAAWVADRAPVKVWEKSRRIGASWATAAEAALTAAADKASGGMDSWYVGYNREMAEEFVRDAAAWALSFDAALQTLDVEECLIQDPRQDILAYRVRFASGMRITALSSRPSNLRGKQGLVIIDEAAFHDDLEELLKAALALTMWGGRVAILSTHDGMDNPFNELVTSIRAGRMPYSLHRTTLDDALALGLFRRICQVRGEAWTVQAEAAWRGELVARYGDAANEELFCVPRASGGAWLTRLLLEGCLDATIPVLRWTPPAEDFVDWSEEARTRTALVWCDEHLAPILRAIPAACGGQGRCSVGEDFARSGDMTAIWVLAEAQDLRLFTPLVLELRKVPFTTQSLILFYVLDRLHLTGAALDARGNGQYLAEVARQRYGPDRVAEVMLSEGWYREHMPPLKATIEDRTISIPADGDIVDDLRAFRMVNGVPRLPQAKTGQGRHGDAGVALALALFARRTMEGGGTFEAVSAGRSVLTAMGSYGGYTRGSGAAYQI